MLYLISPPKIELESFVKELDAALAVGGVSCFQLRLKNIDKSDFISAGHAIKPICAKHEVMFIINDSPEIAQQVGADGVHLGEDDGSIEDARQLLGKKKAIGVSCYNSKHRAFEMAEQGADYVAFGALYPTNTKEVKYYVEPELIEFWVEYVNTPCVAIGGIDLDNIKDVLQTGADYIAMISAVWDHKDGAAAAIKEFNKIIEEYNNVD